MTIYRDSKRIVGTNADRVGTPAISGGWKEVGRTTLGSAGDDLNVSSIPDKRYYMILSDFQESGNIQPGLRLGNSSLDSSANYGERWSTDGGSEVTQSNTYHVQWVDVSGKTKPIFGVNYISNLSAKEKLGISHIMNNGGSGAGNAPARQESVFKWTNTSNPLDILGYNNKGNGDFDTGSEVVVLGYDPDDTHTDNFWEQLASVEGDGSSAVLDSSFTAKKYLWVQAFVDAPTSVNIVAQVGNSTIDTGSNYSYRSSGNGASDAIAIGASWLALDAGSPTVPSFMNMFIINNSSNEKLFMVNQVDGNTAGAGTAPDRRETVGKWANTSNQINRIEIENQSSTNFTSSSFLKVWGSN